MENGYLKYTHAYAQLESNIIKHKADKGEGEYTYFWLVRSSTLLT
jgi:hypothetical protein